MFNIVSFLDGFYKKINTTQIQKQKISEIVKKYTQVEISLEAIEIKNTFVYIKTSPAILNKIFIYKNKILEDFCLLLPDLKITDIR